jgi:RsiW-degrading membrane proteinase PrsW (M82 family)
VATTNLPTVRPADAVALWRLWLLFGLCVVSIIPVMLTSALALPLAGSFASPHAQLATLAFIGSSLPEEAVRFAILYLLGWHWFGIRRPRDGIVFGLLDSFGVSCAENLFYGVSVGWATGVFKLLIALPMHLALGVAMGGLLAVAVRAGDCRTLWIAGALAAPMLLHGVYDFVLLLALANGGANAFGRLAPPVAVYLLVGAFAVMTVLRARRPALAA